MASGATDAGDDMVVGRTNTSEERTILLAKTGTNGYNQDFVLQVACDTGAVLSTQGVDAINVIGSIARGPAPAANGVVATGLNGVVGYVHGAARDKRQEGLAGAGVLGAGKTGPGVFGLGPVGVAGYTQQQFRDTAWENEFRTGVCGRGEAIGVRGKGDDGGVRGESADLLGWGVEGVGTLGAGVRGLSTRGIGVFGDGTPGVKGKSRDDRGGHFESIHGVGAYGHSEHGYGGEFESSSGTPLRVVPQAYTRPLDPTAAMSPDFVVIDEAHRGPQLPREALHGELMPLSHWTERHTLTLWLCVQTGSNSGPPARWAQIPLGVAFDGTG